MDQESKVVRDRQDDTVLRDHLHCLQGYLTLFPVKYTHLILSNAELPSKSKKESFLAVILEKVNHKLKTVMLDSLYIHVFLSLRLL